jgi:Folylpolyglutamate synthase
LQETNGKRIYVSPFGCNIATVWLQGWIIYFSHLVDFRERIRVNGEKISKQYVLDFVTKHREAYEPIQPSFFELTMMMAFQYFADTNVDVAIIEVGLGGRLDSTNIITPVLSIITNISFDHMQFWAIH